MSLLILQNRQRAKAIDLKLLRKITRCLLTDLLGKKTFELGIHLVNARTMAEVNEAYLQHTGSTDVITFDYHEENAAELLPAENPLGPNVKPSSSAKNLEPSLHGEIFISIDDAIAQAREFETTWPSELVRYIVHGVLHLEGYDDLKPALRREMKREENRLLQELSRRFPLSRLRRPKSASKKLRRP